MVSLTSSLDALIDEELRWADVSKSAEKMMMRCEPGSTDGQFYAAIMRAADTKVSVYRKQVRNHPDHSYEGL